MSLIEICEKFEEVIQYLSTTTEETLNISKFFTSYKKIVENFSSQLLKLSDSIKVNTNPESNFNTLSLALLTLKDHVKTVADQNAQFLKNMQLDIIEPLDLFSEHFLQMFQELKYKGLEVYKPIKASQEKVKKQRKEYYRIASDYEKATKLSMTEESRDKQEVAQRSSQKLLQVQETCLNKYIESILEVNNYWDEYDKKMPNIMEDLQQNEESRIHFIKNSLEKYIKYNQKFQAVYSVNLEKLGEIISNISSILDIRVFVDLHKSKNMVYREQFVNYEEYKQRLNEKDSENDEKDEVSVGITVTSLLNQQSINKVSGINSESFMKLSELNASSEGRRLFIDSLKGNSSQPQLTFEKLTQIAALLKETLNSMIKETEYDAAVFLKVIECSTLFYSVENDRKKTLSFFISPHQIWLDSKRWLQTISYSISSRISNIKEAQREKGVLAYLGFFSSSKSFADEKAEKISAYILISQFIFHMSKLKVPEAVAGGIIIAASQEYELDLEKRTLLLTELYSRSDSKIKLPFDSVKKSEAIEFAIKKSAKFLTISDLLEVSLVSKSMKARLLREKFKKVFFCSHIVEKFPELRKNFWLELLKIKLIDIDYDSTLQLLNASNDLIGDVLDIIELDVVRCYQNSSSINKENLSNILKVYAYSNKKIGYCQGMNYIAGTFFLVLQNESQAFKSLFSLISMFKMNSLFNIELAKVKKLFFILDRLIGVFLPELNETFRDSWVFADNYSSGWLITLFSSVFHSRLEVIVQIWDIFLMCGWKGIYRVSISILKNFQKFLFDKSFEDILSILSTLPSSEIFTRDFFIEAMKLKISNRMVKSLKSEFKSIQRSPS